MAEAAVTGGQSVDAQPSQELVALGWDERLAALHAYEAPDSLPARVVAEERGEYVLATATGDRPAVVAGRLRHDVELDPTLAWPAVGDWVGVDPASIAAGVSGAAVIRHVLTRRSALVRRAPQDRGRSEQVLAANVDVVFVVTSLNRDFNVRRLERYLAMAWESGGTPVVVLSKADLADGAPGPGVAGAVLAAETAAPGVEVIAASVVTGAGLDAIRRHVGIGRTVVFVGSSGVGKSSLVNALAGHEVMATGGIREDDSRGRHTTTRRQLLRLGGSVLIDTPGLRELGLADGDGLGTTFEDVERLAAECRFGDCSHRTEPGCAIRAAISRGELERGRLEAYEKLQREARRSELQSDALARQKERKRWAAMSRSVDRHMAMKYGAER